MSEVVQDSTTPGSNSDLKEYLLQQKHETLFLNSKPVDEAISFLKRKVDLDKLYNLQESLDYVIDSASAEKDKQNKKKQDLVKWIDK
jgi:hypothetical protein